MFTYSSVYIIQARVKIADYTAITQPADYLSVILSAIIWQKKLLEKNGPKNTLQSKIP
jgi:hypothetical protein